jgi:hypothetical protein
VNAAGSGAVPAAGGDAAKPAKVSKPRLPSLDSLRFFLIAYIGVGHFVAFATKDAFLLKLFSQVRNCQQQLRVQPSELTAAAADVEVCAAMATVRPALSDVSMGAVSPASISRRWMCNQTAQAAAELEDQHGVCTRVMTASLLPSLSYT